MRNKHSIEKQARETQNKPIKRYNPQSSTNVTSNSLTFIKTPKKTPEVDLGPERTNKQIYDIGSRYRVLEQKYRQLYEETRLRRQLFRRQKEQLQRYREQDDHNQKEIQQLRARIHHERRNQGFHGNLLEESQCRLGEDERISSPSVPKQRSPIAMTKLELPSSHSCINLTPLKKNSRIRLEAASKPQFSRYKFVPTLPLQ